MDVKEAEEIGNFKLGFVIETNRNPAYVLQYIPLDSSSRSRSREKTRRTSQIHQLQPTINY
jgi:hypothetical protein